MLKMFSCLSPTSRSFLGLFFLSPEKPRYLHFFIPCWPTFFNSLHSESPSWLVRGPMINIWERKGAYLSCFRTCNQFTGNLPDQVSYSQSKLSIRGPGSFWAHARSSPEQSERNRTGYAC